jgi:hypothetical protein
MKLLRSDEVVSLRLKRLRPRIEPVGMNSLYSRRCQAKNGNMERLVVEINSSEGELVEAERYFVAGESGGSSPSTSPAASNASFRTVERVFVL